MLFLKNIPTSRKVILRRHLDTENAAMMEHPLLKYTCPEILTDAEYRKVTETVINNYFAEVRVQQTNNAAIKTMFLFWSPKDFYSFFHKVKSMKDGWNAWTSRTNFWILVTLPSAILRVPEGTVTSASPILKVSHETVTLPSAILRVPSGTVSNSTPSMSVLIMQYFIDRGFPLNVSIYHHAICNNNFPLFQFLLDKVSIFQEHSFLDRVVFLLITQTRPDFFRYLIKKYQGDAEHYGHLKERLNFYFHRITVPNQLGGFLELCGELDIV